MRIYIKYLNNKYKVSTKEFESINSIINEISFQQALSIHLL